MFFIKTLGLLLMFFYHRLYNVVELVYSLGDIFVLKVSILFSP